MLEHRAGLLEFMKFLHENDGFPGINYQPSKNDMVAAAIGAFEIARRLRTHPWEEIESVLEVYFVEVARETDGWVWF